VRTPCQDELAIDPGAAYLHYCSNETVEGVQFSAEPGVPVPLVCDMSSDFLTRELDVTRYGVIYVHAQKNLGTAGVTVVVVRGDLLNDAAGDLHTMLDYRTHVKARSIYNTPPLLPIYVLLVMTRWMLRDVGGLAKAAEQTREKAAPIYQAIDRSEGFYRGHAEPGSRSAINVTFDVAGDFLRQRFLEEAGRAGLVGLGGHRSLGGLRASFYVPMPVAGALALRDFMLAFQERHQARCATLLVGEGAAP
jgi:phosphoserine aminotransferase